MSRTKLIKQLKEKNPNLNNLELENLINIFSDFISKALKDTHTIEIRGFGRWYFKKLKENFKAINPRTKGLIYKPKRVKIRFRASKKLNKYINQ